MAKTTDKPAGRPSIYTEELAATICDRIANGESVRSIGKDDAMPHADTIHDWVRNDKQGFSLHYARAHEIGAAMEADEMDEIARDETLEVQRAKLIIDTKKWNLSKRLPKKYGDKLALGGEDGGPIQIKIVDPNREK